jgi:hypothetical protein
MDSVPIMAMPGERVLSVKQTDAFERLIDWMTNNKNEGQAPNPTGLAMGGGVTQVNNFQSVVPPTSAEMARQMREVNRQLNRIKAR